MKSDIEVIPMCQQGKAFGSGFSQVDSKWSGLTNLIADVVTQAEKGTANKKQYNN